MVATTRLGSLPAEGPAAFSGGQYRWTTAFGGVWGGDAGDQRVMPTILVLHDDVVGTVWAMQVDSKGVRPEVVNWVLQKLEFAGHLGEDITLKSDQEEQLPGDRQERRLCHKPECREAALVLSAQSVDGGRDSIGFVSI